MNKKKAKILIVGTQYNTQVTQLQGSPLLYNPTPRRTTNLVVIIPW